MEKDLKREHAYEVIKEEGNQKSIMLYGLKRTDPELGLPLNITEEIDSDGAIWITTSGENKDNPVSVKLGTPPAGLLNTPDLDEHRAIVMDLSITKWIEENV
jgi:hypothetical protein